MRDQEDNDPTDINPVTKQFPDLLTDLTQGKVFVRSLSLSLEQQSKTIPEHKLQNIQRVSLIYVPLLNVINIPTETERERDTTSEISPSTAHNTQTTPSVEELVHCSNSLGLRRCDRQKQTSPAPPDRKGLGGSKVYSPHNSSFPLPFTGMFGVVRKGWERRKEEEEKS